MKKLAITTLLLVCSMNVGAQLPMHEQVHNNTVQIENNKHSIKYLSQQNTINKTEIKQLETKMDEFASKGDISKSTSTAIAIASLEYPAYNKDKKLSLAVATGTYKGKTSIAYGVAYRPNYDMTFSIKGSDDSVATSVGVNL